MKKKFIFTMSIACAATLACTTMIALNHNKIFATLAGGITENGNDRTLIFDKDVALTATDHGYIGQVGKMVGRANWAQTLNNGFMKPTNGFFCIFYNQTLGLENYDYYYGFDQANVTSVSISYKVSTEATFYLKWSKVSATFSIANSSTAVCSQTATVSDDIQTMTFTTGAFFDEQATAKNQSYKGICLGQMDNSSSFELYSVVVNYTCI